MALSLHRPTLKELESRLGLSFHDQGLLRQALVHRSYLNESGGAALDSYERMEFLGDAVLELVISNELYRNLPQEDEGALTKGRAALVCRESLARAARRLALGDYISLGRGEHRNGGPQRDSILEEVFEAMVAAVYLDQGYDAARQFIMQALEPELSAYCRGGPTPENPKSLLQETLQARGQATPRYQVVAIDGPGHQPVFTVAVTVDGETLGQGSGAKKAEAERAAARDALAQYRLTPDPPAAANTDRKTPANAPERPSHPRKNQPNRSAGLCSPSFDATGTPIKNAPPKPPSAAASNGSAASNPFSAPLNWMKRFGRNSRKS